METLNIHAGISNKDIINFVNEKKLTKDDNNNGTVGNIRLYECNNCVVHAEDAKKVVLQGLDGYIFSEKNGQILLCKRSEEPRIREFSAE